MGLNNCSMSSWKTERHTLNKICIFCVHTFFKSNICIHVFTDYDNILYMYVHAIRSHSYSYNLFPTLLCPNLLNLTFWQKKRKYSIRNTLDRNWSTLLEIILFILSNYSLFYFFGNTYWWNLQSFSKIV